MDIKIKNPPNTSLNHYVDGSALTTLTWFICLFMNKSSVPKLTPNTQQDSVDCVG
jgi:hypothetical protein